MISTHILMTIYKVKALRKTHILYVHDQYGIGDNDEITLTIQRKTAKGLSPPRVLRISIMQYAFTELTHKTICYYFVYAHIMLIRECQLIACTLSLVYLYNNLQRHLRVSKTNECCTSAHKRCNHKSIFLRNAIAKRALCIVFLQ
jgi:hypothetical protein